MTSPTWEFSRIAAALEAVKIRISHPAWADSFCAHAHQRGADLVDFVGTEFDALEHIDSNPVTRRLRKEIETILQGIEPRFKLAVLTMARDEALNLAEWVAHTFQIGVEHIFVYTNDNRDGTDQLLRWFERNTPLSPIFTTSAQGVNIQIKNYEHALLLLPELRLYEWVLVIDVDEFVVPAKQYNYNFLQFLEHAPEDAGAVLMPWNWRLWEPSIPLERKLLCERFPHARFHNLFKSAIKIRDVASLRTVHLPMLNGSAKFYDSSFAEADLDGGWAKEPKTPAGGWIDHYWGRSFEEFLIKKLRGDTLDIPTGQFRRNYENYFSWTSKITPDNLSPVPAVIVEGIKQGLASFDQDPTFHAIIEEVGTKYSLYRNKINLENDVNEVFNILKSERDFDRTIGEYEIINLGSYRITHYRKHDKDLVVVFASEVTDGLLEFRATLAALGKSMIFVVESQPAWFTNAFAEVMMKKVAEIAGDYQNIAALGESMGASGALLLSSYCPKLGRILALSPQYSVALPFIQFDKRFSHIGSINPIQRFWSFAPHDGVAKAQILYGDRSWLDSVHAGMFRQAGFKISYVKGVGDLVAKHLKRGASHNYLRDVLRALLDFSTPFTDSALTNALGSLATSRAVDPEFSFSAEKARETLASPPINSSDAKWLPPPEGSVSLTCGGATDQSSVSVWSLFKTTQKDSAGAVTDNSNRPFAFHTDLENRPWWSIDFGARKIINELRIYNRTDNAAVARRGVNFALEVLEESEWKEVFRKNDSEMFDGADGKPFIWRPSAQIVAKEFRIRLLDKNFLHYKRIEIYGPENQD